MLGSTMDILMHLQRVVKLYGNLQAQSSQCWARATYKGSLGDPL